MENGLLLLDGGGARKEKEYSTPAVGTTTWRRCAQIISFIVPLLIMLGAGVSYGGFVLSVAETYSRNWMEMLQMLPLCLAPTAALLVAALRIFTAATAAATTATPTATATATGVVLLASHEKPGLNLALFAAAAAAVVADSNTAPPTVAATTALSYSPATADATTALISYSDNYDLPSTKYCTQN
ncbi:hypothetical protein BDA96_08G198000 [Sorghum bicolor]|uniref:Uncharacterized protein n=2 Tax=Sorghum bicolor TaxID=4558 RepID=A0A921U7N5_SORBI|nr:hypothetical protein BDA96_08G198000 [Sorghum bicolor]KXG24070.1 hypothetical protein SORBI_3008G180500 [Sorghum bicolor]